MLYVQNSLLISCKKWIDEMTENLEEEENLRNLGWE